MIYYRDECSVYGYVLWAGYFYNVSEKLPPLEHRIV